MGYDGFTIVDYLPAGLLDSIAKVNIFTDLCFAGERAMKANASDCTRGMYGYLDTRNAKVAAMKEAVMQKMILFGSENKA